MIYYFTEGKLWTSGIVFSSSQNIYCFRFRGGVGLDAWMFPLREEQSLYTSSPASKLLFVNCENFQDLPNLRTMSLYEGSSNFEGSLVTSNVLTLKNAEHSCSTDVNIVIESSSAASFYKLMGGSIKCEEGLSKTEWVILNSELFNGWAEKCLKN